jgi:hypothetical protein
VAVITPYVGQLRHLELELRRLGIRRTDLLLNTVDAFQGKECEVVVISSVRRCVRSCRCLIEPSSIGASEFTTGERVHPSGVSELFRPTVENRMRSALWSARCMWHKRVVRTMIWHGKGYT